jgi:hypothetical protein
LARPQFDGLKIQKTAEGIKGFERVEEGEEFGELGMRGKTHPSKGDDESFESPVVVHLP